MKFNILLTWSKIMALVLLVSSVYVDLNTIKTGTIFMFAVPFVVFLITGKQVTDMINAKKGE